MLTTTRDKLVQHLKDELRLTPTDFVFLHSGTTGLGKVEGGHCTITDAFAEVLSEGALVIPTFTYSWCRGEPYNPATSQCPPSMGNYGRDAWKDPRFIRGGNPNFSIATLTNAYNQHFIKALFTSPAHQTCFGQGSVFDRMYQLSGERDGYVLLFGGAHNDVIFRSTFLHYVEERMDVPYRYVKRFWNPQNSEEYVDQQVRILSEEEYRKHRGEPDGRYHFPILPRYQKVGEDLVNEKLINIVPFAYSKSRMVHVRKFCDWLIKKLEQNQDYLLD